MTNLISIINHLQKKTPQTKEKNTLNTFAALADMALKRKYGA